MRSMREREPGIARCRTLLAIFSIHLRQLNTDRGHKAPSPDKNRIRTGKEIRRWKDIQYGRVSWGISGKR